MHGKLFIHAQLLYDHRLTADLRPTYDRLMTVGASSLSTYLQETASGLPVVVHAPGNMHDHTALAAFLLGQSNFTYFGTSNGWTDVSRRIESCGCSSHTHACL